MFEGYMIITDDEEGNSFTYCEDEANLLGEVEAQLELAQEDEMRLKFIIDLERFASEDAAEDERFICIISGHSVVPEFQAPMIAGFLPGDEADRMIADGDLPKGLIETLGDLD